MKPNGKLISRRGGPRPGSGPKAKHFNKRREYARAYLITHGIPGKLAAAIVADAILSLKLPQDTRESLDKHYYERLKKLLEKARVHDEACAKDGFVKPWTSIKVPTESSGVSIGSSSSEHIEKAKREEKDNSDRFHRLVLPHKSRMLSFANHLTKNMQDAKDLVQSAFLTALSKMDSLQDETKAKAWVIKILENIYYSNKRKIREQYYDPRDLNENIGTVSQQEDEQQKDEQLEAYVLKHSEGFMKAFSDEEYKRHYENIRTYGRDKRSWEKWRKEWESKGITAPKMKTDGTVQISPSKPIGQLPRNGNRPLVYSHLPGPQWSEDEMLESVEICTCEQIPFDHGVCKICGRHGTIPTTIPFLFHPTRELPVVVMASWIHPLFLSRQNIGLVCNDSSGAHSSCMQKIYDESTKPCWGISEWRLYRGQCSSWLYMVTASASVIIPTREQFPVNWEDGKIIYGEAFEVPICIPCTVRIINGKRYLYINGRHVLECDLLALYRKLGK